MATIRKNITMNTLQAARLTAEAKRKGTSESGIISSLIMAHLPPTRLDAEAESAMERAMDQMPSDWGETPSWMREKGEN